MAKVLLIAAWTDGQGQQHPAGEVLAVDDATAAALRDSGICDPNWVGPTGGKDTTDWAGPGGTDTTDWVGPTKTP